jgi:hypothetical protein
MRKSKKDRQHNGQKEKDKRTNKAYTTNLKGCAVQIKYTITWCLFYWIYATNLKGCAVQIKYTTTQSLFYWIYTTNLKGLVVYLICTAQPFRLVVYIQ